VVTVISTVPAGLAGLTAVIWVSLLNVKLVAGTVPNSTLLAPVKPVPVIVTDVPPVVDPSLGEMPATVGGAYVYWNRSAELVADVPPGVVTVTSTVPLPAGLAGGLTAVIWVSLLNVKLLAGTVPNSTFVAPVKSRPVIMTVVFPAAGPNVGEMLVTVGAGM
jgi:hypothetical protein